MTGPSDRLHLVHHHPGRIRVRSEVFRGEESPAVEAVREAVEAILGVTAVEHNALTGSLLIHYEPGLAEPGMLAERIAEAAGLSGVIDDASERAGRIEPAARVVQSMRALNSVTREVTGGRADLTVLVPAALAGVAAYSFSRSKDRLPRWDNLMWWSYSIFLDWHRLRQMAAAKEQSAVP